MRILVIFGTRPEAIKMAPVLKALKAAKDLDVRVCVTGQHREMLDQVLTLFKIHPDYDLNTMKNNQTLAEITSSIIVELQKVIADFRPGMVLVHGDTTTTLAASLSAYYHQVAVGHVEAGLRTGNIYAPWPEEVNRKVASVIAAMHFAPTIKSKQNLLNEGIPSGNIVVTGNTVIDALQEVVGLIKRNEDHFKNELRNRFGIPDGKKLILVTGHRRESFGGGFARICEALVALSRRGDVEIVYPVHLNPNVKRPVEALLGGLSNVRLFGPQDYLPFVCLMNRAEIIITDSGGVQEEGPSLGKPVLVMRDVTERPEAVDAGTVKLVGTDVSRIVGAANQLLDDPAAYRAMSSVQNPYGDGQAASRIVASIRAWKDNRAMHKSA